ncbi:MAG: MFS transporter [Gammaproteobacteria bacterium]|nr:MFS transporter [Gammaproteobacteria bacterium]
MSKLEKAWISYDLGNSAFATTVLAAFFPLFFPEFWGKDLTDVQSGEYILWTIAISNFLLFISAPVIGALTDINNSSKKIFITFTTISIFCVAILYFIEAGSWFYALVFFGIANYFFSAGNILYDKILVKITSPDRYSKISGIGYAWGYFGGGFLFLLNSLMFLFWKQLNLQSPADAILLSFLSVSIWWFIFLLPLAITFKEENTKIKNKEKSLIQHSFKKIFLTIKSISQNKRIFLFLLAFFLYIDGVHTVMSSAVVYAKLLELDDSAIIIGLLIVQFVAFPFTIFWSYIADKFGDKLVIYLSILIYVLVILFSLTLDNSFEFYILAALVGSVQGGIQASSRSFFAFIIPKDKSGEFFGFFNMFGKAGAFIGPTLVGVAVSPDNIQLALLPVILLFIIGGVILIGVKDISESEKLP